MVNSPSLLEQAIKTELKKRIDTLAPQSILQEIYSDKKAVPETTVTCQELQEHQELETIIPPENTDPNKPIIILNEIELLDYLKSNPNAQTFIDPEGTEIKCMLTADAVHVPSSIKVIKQTEPVTESEPALLHQVGLYLTPPHGELIAKGKKTAIVKSFDIKQHLDTQLYLLSGDLCYGIIKLKPPVKISTKEFKARYEEHKISEAEKLKWWRDYDTLYLYKVKIIRLYDSPKKYEQKQGPQVFVRNVKFLSEEFTEKQTEDEPTRQEVLKQEKEKGNWFIVRQPKDTNFKYVAQLHFRGDSLHVDLRLEANGHLVGWTLDTPSLTAEELEGPQAKYAETKYNRFLYPRDPSQTKDFQILVEQKLKQPSAWLKVEGKIPPGGIGATVHQPAEFKIISSGTARWGTSKSDFNEIFLTPDPKWKQEKTVAGRWIITNIPRPTKYTRAGEEEMMWAMFKPNEQRPYTETHNLEKEAEKAEKENIEMLWQHPDSSVQKYFNFKA